MNERIKEFEGDTFGPVWVDCPHHWEAIALLGKLLGTEFRPRLREGAPSGRAPSYVVFCPDGEGLVPGLKRLRALAPEALILVFGSAPDSQLARAALRAGARGFVHAGMEPGQLIRAVSADSREELLLPKNLIEELFEKAEEERAVEKECQRTLASSSRANGRCSSWSPKDPASARCPDASGPRKGGRTPP